MKTATAIALLGLIAMTAVLAYAFTMGSFSVEGARLMAMPWGVVSLVDLYVGFALFSCWIAFRENAWLPSIAWIVLMMVLGFWAGALYTLVALRASRGDWNRFWYGNRAGAQAKRRIS